MKTEQDIPKRFSRLYQKLRSIRIPYKITFFVIGIASTIWFLIRVIPKPSRAGYPCMKAAAPFMSSFVIYLLSLTGSALLFRRARVFFHRTRYLMAAAAFLGAVVVFAVTSNFFSDRAIAAEYTAEPGDFPPNQPMGEERGVFPGRVVWAWDPDATNENCTNSHNDWVDPDAYWMAKNNDQDVINRMMDDILMKLTGSYNVGTAWNMLFKDFNQRKGRGSAGYSADQTIFIKINAGGAGWLTNGNDLSHKTANWAKNYYPNAETSAPMAIALLDQLVKDYGIPQENIYIGDPNAHILKDNYDQMVALFPNVKYMDKDHSDLGRTKITMTSEEVFFWSDPSTITNPKNTRYSWEEVVNADYLINLATLKAHARAGVTLTAKNHFGTHSNADGGATPLHPGLVCEENWDVSNARNEYGMYRTLTDIMGHDMLGGNTVLFIVEGLWGGPEAVSKPEKWQSAPFNDDWPSSILASQDAVALESVCFDLLKNEYNNFDDVKYSTPWYGGVDDHLHQAADQANWPEGFTYDPEGDGTPMGSMGVHEHWNNEVDRQYSRNLGYDYGIELVSTEKSLVQNTLLAREADTPPVIDGEASDACWEEARWYHIDQTWINYGEQIDSSDFFGRFKVSWSESENLVYFLVEITDDTFVDGYVYPGDGYPNFDIVEVFLDEDRSGGFHVFDDNPDLGPNSESAFSYHLAVNAPADGETTTGVVACDIDGTGWGDKTIVDYAGHFPELTMKRSGNRFIYEFSMKVHNDTYDHSDPEASREILEGGKEMGMSLAYCDNDTPDTERDNFFGSVWVPADAYNDHWKNADGYGSVRLVNDGTSLNHAVEVAGSIADFEIAETGTELVVHSNLYEVFYDPDSDTLDFSVDCDHTELTFTTGDAALKVIATEQFEGEAEVTVTAGDGEFEAIVTFRVTRSVIGTGTDRWPESPIRCYPNPYSDLLQAEVELGSGYTGAVTIQLFDLAGKQVASLQDARISGGFGSFTLEMGDQPAGHYILRLRAGEEEHSMILTRR